MVCHLLQKFSEDVLSVEETLDTSVEIEMFTVETC